MVKRKTQKCKNPSTFAGLNIWFKNEYEKLGWMVLAKERGMHDKVQVYKNSVHNLEHSLQCKINSVQEHDRKEDLQIMLTNTRILCKFVDKHL